MAKQNHSPYGRVKKGGWGLRLPYLLQNHIPKDLEPSVRSHFWRCATQCNKPSPHGSLRDTGNPNYSNVHGHRNKESLQSWNLRGHVQNWWTAGKMGYMTFLFCVCVHVCEHRYSCATVCTQWSEGNLNISPSPFTLFKTGSPTGCSKLTGPKSLQDSLSLPPFHCRSAGMGVHVTTPHFLWVLRIWTQVLPCTQQILHLFIHPLPQVTWILKAQIGSPDFCQYSSQPWLWNPFF